MLETKLKRGHHKILSEIFIDNNRKMKSFRNPYARDLTITTFLLTKVFKFFFFNDMIST